MAENTIIRALSIVHQKRLQEDGLWRLDSPTEAALVAQLCNRQQDEEVVVSVGNPQPEPDYCFAHLAPPHIHGSDKMRHHYVLGQHHHHCAVELAMQQGLLPAHKKQQPAHPEAIPCSPVAATPQHMADEQPCTPCRTTPLSQLRAEVSAAVDSSPCNNIVRRLAAEISQDSPALQVTLNEYRRSTASRHSSFVHRDSRASECSIDEHLTPAASPGRGWVQPPSTKHWDTPEFDLQSSTCHFPTSPSAASCCSDSQAGAQAPGATKGPADKSAAQQQQAAADTPQGLTATSSEAFKGFGPAGTQEPALASSDSTKLATPRLVELRCTSVSSSFSSSTSTVTSSHYDASTSLQQEAAAAVQSSAAALTNEQGVPAGATSTAANEHASKQATDVGTFVPPAAAAVDSGVTGSSQTAGSGVHAAGSHAGSSAHPACPPIEPAFVETGFWGSRDSSSNGTVIADHPGSNSPLGVASQVPQHNAGIITSILSHADSGFLSCDEDMDLQGVQASILHSTCQHSPQAAAHAGRQAAGAVLVGDALHGDIQVASAAVRSLESSEPCQQPLSPLLLRQLTQQLSFKEVAADSAAAGYARSEAATSCCDWATVYSYEEGDS